MQGEKSRKELIVDTATRLFADKGFKETSVAEIATESGVAEGTIFYHFDTKEALLLHILERLRSDIVAEYREFTSQRAPASGLDMVEDAIAFYLYLATKMETSFMLLYRHYPYRLALTNPACRSHLEQIYACLVDIFEAAVATGQKDGTIGEMSTRKVALLFFTMVDGIVRLKFNTLYDAGALYNELVAACRRMLQAEHPEDSQCRES
jgi:AcrR family transcriptional regulator